MGVAVIFVIIFIVFILVLANGEPDKPRYKVQVIDRETGETTTLRPDNRHRGDR